MPPHARHALLLVHACKGARMLRALGACAHASRHNSISGRMRMTGLGALRCCAAWAMQRIASDELGISEEEMDWRLKQLTALLPGLEARLIRVRLAALPGGIDVNCPPDDVAQPRL